MTAPVVMTLEVPTVHWLVRAAGSLNRQLNDPCWAWAASWGAVRGPAGVKVTGR